MFQPGKEMVRVVQSAERRPVIQPLQEGALRGELARAANWSTVSQKGSISSCPPPIDVVRDLAALRSWPSDIPPLADIIEVPALRPDGSIILDPGYDARTGVFYASRPEDIYAAFDAMRKGDGLKAVVGMNGRRG